MPGTPNTGFFPFTVSEKFFFFLFFSFFFSLLFFETLCFIGPQQTTKLSYTLNNFVKTISAKTQQKLAIFVFPHYKFMGSISCHSNQSYYPTGIEKRCTDLCREHIYLVQAPSQDRTCGPWFTRQVPSPLRYGRF